MLENLKKFYQEETLAERRERMLPAAIYGALIGTVYVLTLSFINVLSYPNLPLGIDWARALGMWIGFSLAFAFFGAVAAWFTEEYMGIIGGAVIFTVLMAIVFLVLSGANDSTQIVQSIITALPLVGVSMLGAWGLRWAARRHLAIRHSEEPKLRRKDLTRHVLIVMLAGFIPGILGRMDLPSVQALQQLDELLQVAPNDSSVWPRLPLKQVPALQDHFGLDYVFYSRQSAVSAGALDVTIRFADGYTMTCVLPVGGGSFITDCNEGDEVATGP